MMAAWYESRRFPTEVVDTVGAGIAMWDISARLEGLDIETQALRFC